MRIAAVCCLISLVVTSVALADDIPTASVSESNEKLFRESIAPILRRSCVHCHQGDEPKGELSLLGAKSAMAGGESGSVITPGDPDDSLLMDYIAGDEPEMPQGEEPLSAGEVELIRRWIAGGAAWPQGMMLEATWWSFEPLVRPTVPKIKSDWIRTPIDAFVLKRLHRNKLAPSARADRRTLIRRLYFDLIGLPPTPEEVESFVNDKDPKAYGQLVNRLLDSPRYGERWARHWLDVVHYGDTHGYDKDKVRPNAWPYRDYVIRSLNEDKPYRRFVLEQLAGDVLYPDTRDGIVATGFIAAGPFDFVGHIELREGLVDKDITRNLDRDDMVSTAMNTFTSLTAQCARCHDHKFDPISQEDYYSLQAVFAGVERADRPYPDSKTESLRRSLEEKRLVIAAQQKKIQHHIASLKTPEILQLEKKIAKLGSRLMPLSIGDSKLASRTLGYHSKIETKPDVTKWVQVDLGSSGPIDTVVLFPSHVKYAAHPGPGFGFPVRFKLEASNDEQFKSGVMLIADYSKADFKNPGDTPLVTAAKPPVSSRYVRLTAIRLWQRTNDFALALSEMAVLSGGRNIAQGVGVTSLDSIEAGGSWGRAHLVDGMFAQTSFASLASKQQAGLSNLLEQLGQQSEIDTQLHALQQQRDRLVQPLIDETTREKAADVDRELAQITAQIAALPARPMVYAAASDFRPEGNFRPAPGGKPRPIRLLHRGNVKSPGKLMQPGTVGLVKTMASRFKLKDPNDEGQRRVALARWIVHRDNPLTWRSIVNRIWQYHFGRAIVDSANDFGHMGVKPTHPQLLDYLAVEMRDGGESISNQSIKQLHRLIVSSATYQQVSTSDEAKARLDAGNRFLWRMNRRRLEAEAIRDSVLAVAGKLDTKMGGPGFRRFGFKDDHSPHYKYLEHDPDDPASHRRAIYRFIVRSVPDPFMETLDCADPSASVAKRIETLTALQALTLMNNKFMLRMSEHLAARVQTRSEPLPALVREVFRIALSRDASDEEASILSEYAKQHGLPATCRLLFNMNEFVFID